MRQSLSSLVTLVAVLCVVPATAGAQALAIYDTFDGTTIDPTKWRGTESASSFALVATDSARGIVNDSLKLALTTHGIIGPGTRLAGETRNRVVLNHAALVGGTPRITVMRSDLTVMRAVARNCAGSEVATSTQAGMIGFFFNDGTGTALPSDLTGDVLAVLDVRHSSRTGRTINAAIARCTNSSCSSANILDTTVFARSWAIGEAVTLTIRWQPGLDRFSFVASSAAEVPEIELLSYNLSDTQAARAFLKDLHVNNAIPHCAKPVKAAIDARFNNMAINATAVAAIGE